MTDYSTYKLITYGCQMNQYDSGVIASTVESMGARPVDDEEDADLIILNTCCVRNSAENKVYGRLGQYKALKDQRPHLVIAVLGCLAQKDKEDLMKRFPHVSLVLGPRNLWELAEMLQKARREDTLCCTDGEGNRFISPTIRKEKVTGYVTISIGCDCFCTFCIVPHVRGRIKSRPVDDIIAEARQLTDQGYKEIFLLGQNVNTYGFDLPNKPSFFHLLQKVNQVPGIRRIRFTSPHPKDFSRELIEGMGRLENLCPAVHLPLQAGSDTVLQRMNRKYDTARYEEIVRGLRESVPGIAVSTDLIVGFPGETDSEYEEGLQFIERMQFDQAFMFAYSRRSGTVADRMPGQVPRDIKMNRLYRLIEMQNQISRDKNEKAVGTIRPVLVEGTSKKDPSRVTGRTDTNKVVNFPGNADDVNRIIKVRLSRAYTWGFLGEPA